MTGWCNLRNDVLCDEHGKLAQTPAEMAPRCLPGPLIA